MRTWRFGVIGCGAIADFHMKAVQAMDNARLVCVSSRNEAKARSVAEREGCDWTADYKELLARTDIDIVCVTTSSGSHARIGMDALAAGKHLIVEKPLAMTAGEAQRLVREAEKRGLTLSVIFQRRFEPPYMAVKQAIDSGAIGKLLIAEVSLPNYRTQAYYDQADWRGTRAEDGGALMNQGIHSLDLLLWYCGEAQAVIGKTATQTHKIEAEDLGLAIVQFKNGAFGTVMASTNCYPGFNQSISLYGEKGAIKLNGTRVTHWSVPGVEEPAGSDAAGGAANPLSISFEYHRMQLEDVVSAIENGRAPLIAGEDGWRAVQLVEAIYESAARGAQVEVAEIGRNR